MYVECFCSRASEVEVREQLVKGRVRAVAKQLTFWDPDFVTAWGIWWYLCQVQ